jgi:hypothetical protein
MALAAHPFSASDGDEWNDFVERRSRNGTILHSRKFFEHNPANAADDASLVFRDGGRIVGVLPAALSVKADGSRVLHSHPRSTYGGFVVDRSAGFKPVLAMVDAAVEHARALNAARVIVRNPFRIFHAAPSDESDYAMWHRGFSLATRELELAIPLSGMTADELLASFDGKTRNQVRKAHRLGVTVEESADFPAFWAILESALVERHSARPTHSVEEIVRVRALLGERVVRLFAALHDGRIVAGLVGFVANDRVLHAQYIAARTDSLHLCPVNAVVHHVATWAAEHGFAYLNLGMSTEDAGTKVNLGLLGFKEGFGAHGVLRETMTLTVIP